MRTRDGHLHVSFRDSYPKCVPVRAFKRTAYPQYAQPTDLLSRHSKSQSAASLDPFINSTVIFLNDAGSFFVQVFQNARVLPQAHQTCARQR